MPASASRRSTSLLDATALYSVLRKVETSGNSIAARSRFARQNRSQGKYCANKNDWPNQELILSRIWPTMARLAQATRLSRLLCFLHWPDLKNFLPSTGHSHTPVTRLRLRA